MPANLTPQYYSAEKRYKEAQTDSERLNALKEMLAIIPKHKGTDKLQADLKRRIARIKEDIQKGGKGGKRQFRYHVDKEGLPQLVLVGQANSGKSQLLAQLTHAKPEIADYPFTTRMYLPGVLIHENYHIQLVDLPAVSQEFMEFWVPEIIKNADGILLTIDIGVPDALSQVKDTFEILKEHRIIMTNKIVDADPYSPEQYLKGILVGNKSDLKNARENWEVLLELYAENHLMCPVSAANRTNLDELKQMSIDLLDIIRVYSKPPGKDPNREKPFILKNGSTLHDFANMIHHDFADNLKFARVWGSATFDGQRVKSDYVMQDEDVIELHI